VRDTTTPAEGVVLHIADNGAGIAPEVLPKVFDAFFTTRTTVGTGIGLFIAKNFVEGHGGAISIESHTQPEKQGTNVRIFLPLDTAYA
jgi:signal transduction histidine kinase